MRILIALKMIPSELASEVIIGPWDSQRWSVRIMRISWIWWHGEARDSGVRWYLRGVDLLPLRLFEEPQKCIHHFVLERFRELSEAHARKWQLPLLSSSLSGDLCSPHHTLVLQVFVSIDGITILVHRRAFSCRGYKHPFPKPRFFLSVFSPRSSANPPQNIDHQLVTEGTFYCEGSSKQEEEEEAEPEPEKPA